MVDRGASGHVIVSPKVAEIEKVAHEDTEKTAVSVLIH